IRDKLVTGVQTCALPIFTAPVEWVALAPGPRAPPPDDAVSGRALGDLPRRLVVAHGVEVVLEPPGAPRGVHARERRALAEVRLRSEERRVGKEWRSRWGA